MGIASAHASEAGADAMVELSHPGRALCHDRTFGCPGYRREPRRPVRGSRSSAREPASGTSGTVRMTDPTVISSVNDQVAGFMRMT